MQASFSQSEEVFYRSHIKNILYDVAVFQKLCHKKNMVTKITLFISVDFPTHVDFISMEFPILYLRYHRKKFLNNDAFCHKDLFLPL